MLAARLMVMGRYSGWYRCVPSESQAMEAPAATTCRQLYESYSVVLDIASQQYNTAQCSGNFGNSTYSSTERIEVAYEWLCSGNILEVKPRLLCVRASHGP